MDLLWGFNNICIKEEDQWKGTFKTPFGLFKPAAMPFGMNNAPSTFCQAMSQLLKRLLVVCRLGSKADSRTKTAA
jgi:hypothetical protein